MQQPKDIAEKWQALSGVIRPVNPYPYKAHRNFGETISEREIFEQSVVDKHTYPAPDLADGEYDADGLEFYYPVYIGERPPLSIRLKLALRKTYISHPIATTEEKGESQPDTELIQYVLYWCGVKPEIIAHETTAITQAWGKEKGK